MEHMINNYVRMHESIASSSMVPNKHWKLIRAFFWDLKQTLIGDIVDSES